MRFALLLSLTLLSASACGPAKEKCSTSTCSGCCDANGDCQAGVTPLACGSGGLVCQTCSQLTTCSLGYCMVQAGNGGGGASGGGGGSGGGNGGGTGGGGALCSPATCSGCCDSGGRCQSGTSDATCGRAGNSCAACLLGQACNLGLCVSTGGGGGAGGGGGTCSPGTCAGCCDSSGFCQLGTSVTSCGASGSACTACFTGQVCSFGACLTSSGGGGGAGGGSGGGGGSFCSPSNCAGCCSSSGSCLLGNSVTSCGTSGNACVACFSGQVCSFGACLTSSGGGGGAGGGAGGGGGSFCSPSNCAGCCSAAGSCLTGSSVTSCGTNGNICQACFSGQVCSFGQCLTSGGGGGAGGGGGSGSTRVGNYVSFGSGNTFTASYLLGFRLTLSQSLLLTHFGVISFSSGQSARFALYADNAGTPTNLMAQSSLTTLTNGSVEVPATSSVSLPPGNYWLMGNYGSDAQIGKGGTSTDLKYISLPVSDLLPTTFGTHTTYGSTQVNYYLVGF